MRAVLFLALAATVSRAAELLQNPGFESKDHWGCWGYTCEVISDSHSGSHSLRTNGRTQWYQGPQQQIQTSPGKTYRAKAWFKILNDKQGKLGQNFQLEASFKFADGTSDYINAGNVPMVTTSDGWMLLTGDFQAPSKPSTETQFYFQGPDPGVDYAVDDASVTEVTPDSQWRNKSDDVIERVRKSDINFRVTTAAGIDKSQVEIQVLQKTQSFPFGTAMSSWDYVDPAQQDYRDALARYFNWVTPGNALKWRQLEWNQGPRNYDRALKTVNGLRAQGLKVRGHNMVWSVAQFIPTWVKEQSGDQLRETVREHIEWTCNLTRGLLEHWDVNNENLHGQWFQEALQDRDYDLELFRMMQQYCPGVKLFLNEYNVVAQGATTAAYKSQGERFRDANVGLYGMGVQTHFHKEQEPNPTLMKERLDSLATVGVPLWVTELTCESTDPNKLADYFETSLRALYGHPSVEGIIFWSPFAKSLQAGASSGALIVGDGTSPHRLTEAGRRVFDLLENEWMTDDTRTLSQAGDQFTVRGFHGDYEVHVRYQGNELTNLKQTFTLDKTAKTVNLNVHT